MCIDVVSGGELYTAIKAGFPAERIEFNGNNKLLEELCCHRLWDRENNNRRHRRTGTNREDLQRKRIKKSRSSLQDNTGG